MKYLRKQPLSILLIIAIWVVCMIPIPETPLNNVAFMDKWTHFIMYATVVIVISSEYGRRSKRIQWSHYLVGAVLLPVVMGGLVELAQAYLTNGMRSGDWLDFLANSVGVLTGCIVGIPLAMHLTRRK